MEELEQKKDPFFAYTTKVKEYIFFPGAQYRMKPCDMCQRDVMCWCMICVRIHNPGSSMPMWFCSEECLTLWAMAIL